MFFFIFKKGTYNQVCVLEYMVHKKVCFFINLLLFFSGFSLTAQTYISVPVNNAVYYLIEQAQIRGLCGPLPEVKPYSQKLIAETLRTILEAEPGKLTDTERDVLQKAYQKFKPQEKGLNWQQGAYYFSTKIPKTNVRYSGDIGVGLQMAFSGARYSHTEEFAWGLDNVIYLYTDGDVGEQFSYGFHFLGHITRAPRSVLGTYNTYYEGFEGNAEEGYMNRNITTYSHPLAFFPYTYRKTWDGFIVFPGSISSEGLENWPDQLAIGPMITGELSGAFFGDALTYRFGRMRREWASMDPGRSLVFNGAAQPFIALEATFKPFYWFNFSSLTGILEYFNEEDLKTSAWTSQNAFSIEQLELNYKNYLHFDLGTTAIWTKRFELGYIFPININFLYQDNIGDFDNMGFFFNLKGQYPGIGKVWFSFFADEINPATLFTSEFSELDRNMYAFQGGIKAAIPWLAFTSVALSYTKIEPYCYTHTRIFVPWYNNEYDGKPMPMETAYINNGEGLGYYLPPNSDELLLRFETLPTPQTTVHFQYQMVRHGAAHGSKAVDGSSFLSELDPSGRSEKAILKKFFLHDGAYQWQHIFRIGAEYTLESFKVPIRFFAEFGVVYSYYTDIDGSANAGESYSYSVIDTAEYPQSTGIIATIGFRLYL